jgi:hypothetical protein
MLQQAYTFVQISAVKFLTPLERTEADRAETRRPKSEIRKKPEARNPNDNHAGNEFSDSGFGFRISFGLRISEFGIRNSEFGIGNSRPVLEPPWSKDNVLSGSAR